MRKGLLIWITGLSGVGKSTVGRSVADALRNQGVPTIFLDGDLVRHLLGNTHGHGIADRKATAGIYVRLCHELVQQGITVVFATISLFHDVHDANRSGLGDSYVEVLLTASEVTLKARNPQSIYTSATDVMGVHQLPQYPTAPDLVLPNEKPADAMAAQAAILELVASRTRLH